MYTAWRRANCRGSLRPELFLIRSCHVALTAFIHVHSAPAARVVLSLPTNWDSFSYEVFRYVVRAHQPPGTLSVFRIFFAASTRLCNSTFDTLTIVRMASVNRANSGLSGGVFMRFSFCVISGRKGKSSSVQTGME